MLIVSTLRPIVSVSQLDYAKHAVACMDVLMSDLTPEERKELVRKAFKEAAHEWLNEQYTQVGKWTIRGIGAMILVALFIFLSSHGFDFRKFIAGM